MVKVPENGGGEASTTSMTEGKGEHRLPESERMAIWTGGTKSIPWPHLNLLKPDSLLRKQRMREPAGTVHASQPPGQRAGGGGERSSPG